MRIARWSRSLVVLGAALPLAFALACGSLYSASEDAPADAAPDTDAAAPPDPGDDLDAARPDVAPAPIGSRYAFVTSGPINGALGNAAGADKFCNDTARPVPFLRDRVFVAFVAFGTPPKLPVLGDGGPWVMPGGQMVTATPPTADTIIANAPMQNEIGKVPFGQAQVWTGIGADRANCMSWTSSGFDIGNVGSPFVAAEWLKANGNPARGCLQPSRLYCFER